MNFLTPLYLAGSLLIALPIIFHLIRRTPRDRIPFSSLMFLRESPPRVTRRSRLENILLLLLRATALIFLACAFARPFLREPLQAETERGDFRVIAIGLDISASMRRDDLWRQATARASRAIADLRPIDHVMLFTFDRQVRTILNFDDWLDIAPGDRISHVNNQLSSIAPSWGSTSLGTALAAAADAVDSHATAIASSGMVPEQHVLLISDLQQGSDLAGLRQYDWPERVVVELATVTPQRRTNASIQLVEDRGEAKDLSDSNTLRLRIANAAESNRDQFRVGWQGSESSRVDVYLAPSKSRVVQVPATPPDGLGEQLVLEGDEQEFDNRLFVVPHRTEAVSVLFLGGGRPQDTTKLLYYFERAFPKTQWRSVQLVAREHADQLVMSDLAETRFVVLADSASAETVRALQTFVETGGTLLGVMTSTAAAESIGQVMGIEGWSVDEAAVREYAMLGEIDFQHPLFAPFADPRYGDFTKIHFWRHRRIDLAPFATSRVLARFDDRDPALVEIPRGQGHGFVLTAGWQPSDSQLAVSSKFVPLLGGMLDYAIGTKKTGASVRVNDLVPLNEASTMAVRIRRPDGTETELPAGSNEFRDTNEPGIYTVQTDGPAWQFAVNLDPAESQTDPLSPEELEQFGVCLTGAKSSSRTVADAARQRQMHAFELESRQKLWRWLLVGVLAVLLVESWMAGRTGRVKGLQKE